jgi:4-amino-4-deoxy-L-arabinose transferase-like glycosyltransferase
VNLAQPADPPDPSIQERPKATSQAAAFFRSDTGVLVLLALARIILHTATNGHYGFHRDELQTLDDARHLDWGFVAYPPITPLLGRFELILFGTSLAGFRFFAAVAVSTVMVLAGLIAQELGGTRQTQVLAAVATGVAPFSLVQGAVLQYVSFDYLWGVSAAYFLVRLLKSQNPRWWIGVGAALGLGMETRYTMGFLALGIVGAVLLTPARRYLLSGWLWAGVAVSLVIFLPNLVWQARHQFISLDFLAHLHARDFAQGRYHGFYREQFLTCVNVVTVPLMLLGLWFYLARREGRPYRLIGWTFVVAFALFAIAGARSYYTAPIYPMLLAAGSVLLQIVLDKVQPRWSRLVYRVQWISIVLSGAAVALLVLPVTPRDSAAWKFANVVHDQFREEVGWPELAQSVAHVYHSLPPQERDTTGILTGNYGESGALNLYGPALGLPHAMSLTNSFWYRGYDPRLPQIVILTGFSLEEAQKLFASCQVVAQNTNPDGVVNEESHDHPDILLCRNLRMPWPIYWARYRRYG